jgi:hypothetical protein
VRVVLLEMEPRLTRAEFIGTLIGFDDYVSMYTHFQARARC